MPTYEYACRECGEHLEVVQSFRDAPLTECPKCAGPLRKVFHPIGVAFKGSGFYKTDSRTGSKSGSSSSSSKSESSGESSKSESSKSESSKSESTKSGSTSKDSSTSSGSSTPSSEKSAAAS